MNQYRGRYETCRVVFYNSVYNLLKRLSLIYCRKRQPLWVSSALHFLHVRTVLVAMRVVAVVAAPAFVRVTTHDHNYASVIILYLVIHWRNLN